MVDLETSIMKTITEKTLEYLMGPLLFLRKKDVVKVKEFSQLVTSRYEFLIGQLEKMLKDYSKLSSRVKEMHAGVISLCEELLGALPLRCRLRECERRKAI